MNFNKIIELLYIKGYSEKQEVFLNELIQGSVKASEKIDLADSTLKGYFSGNNITNLAPLLIDAGISVDQMSAYIESLYEKEHKNSPTYHKRFHGKKYKDALYLKAKQTFPDITLSNMATVLAEKVYEIIKTSYDQTTTKSEKESAENVYTSTIQSNTITDGEKNAIKNLCTLINQTLFAIKHQTCKIKQKQADLKMHSESNNNNYQRYILYLETDLKHLINEFNSNYSELEKYCNDIIILLESKIHLCSSFKKVYDIVRNISCNEYKVTYNYFNSTAFSVMVSDFEKHYNSILNIIDTL